MARRKTRYLLAYRDSLDPGPARHVEVDGFDEVISAVCKATEPGSVLVVADRLDKHGESLHTVWSRYHEEDGGWRHDLLTKPELRQLRKAHGESNDG